MESNQLVEIITNFPNIWESPRKLRTILIEYYPEKKLIRNLLFACAEELIPQDLAEKQSCTIDELDEYAHRVVSAYGCDAVRAKEAVYLWAEALKISNLPAHHNIYPGHEQCEMLRNIRRKIAVANNIDFEPQECNHDAPCRGTCPVCDEEVRYLDRELQRKMYSGEKINIDGIASSDIKKSKVSIPYDRCPIVAGAPRRYTKVEI